MRRYLDEQGASASVRMICFHHAGGGSSLFRGWQRALGPHVAVCPVLLPGHEGRLGEPRHTDLAELVADIDRDLNDVLAAPHVLFGHSMGALLAYTLTCRRADRDAPLPRALLVSGYPAPYLPTPLPLVGDDPDEVVSILSSIGGLPSGVLEWEQGLAEWLPVAVDDLRLCRDVQPVDTRLPIPVHVFGADADPLVATADLRAWDRCSDLPLDVRVLRGDHFYLRDHPQQLWAELRSVLRAYA